MMSRVLAVSVTVGLLVGCGSSSGGGGEPGSGSGSRDAGQETDAQIDSSLPSETSGPGEDSALSADTGPDQVDGSAPSETGARGEDSGSHADTGPDEDAAIRDSGSIAPGFFVATTGEDSNPGTLAKPFATFGKAQSAMQASSMLKTTYIRAGTYNLSGASNSCLGGDGITLTAADDGETWSYYPPDGFNSAVIDGGATSPSTGFADAFCVSHGSNITWNGLQMQRFNSSAIYMVDGNNNVIENNIVHDITMKVGVGLSGISIRDSADVSVLNNYVYNTRDNAIGAHTASSGSIDGLLYANNFAYNVCTGASDCGGLYIQDFEIPASTNLRIQNNYIRDSAVGVSNGVGSIGGVGVYLDDGASNVTVSGNVISGVEDFCLQIHGGKNNVFTGNVCDESSVDTKYILYYQQTTMTPLSNYPMTGNVLDHNIIIAGSSGSSAGTGYSGDGTAPNPPSVGANGDAYHNYVGTGINSSGSAGAASDKNPVSEDPQITCWGYQIASGSPVFKSPVSFPGITGGWGPPGFAVPQIGTPPSCPHGC